MRGPGRCSGALHIVVVPALRSEQHLPRGGTIVRGCSPKPTHEVTNQLPDLDARDLYESEMFRSRSDS